MSKFNKRARRASTLAMSLALIIAASSCSGVSNNYGKLDKEAHYAEAGDYYVTNSELWDELKWNTKDILDTQIENVIVDEQIKNISAVLDQDYSSLDDERKKSIALITKSEKLYNDEGFKQEEFNQLKEKFKTRLVDYVVQDIYNFSFNNDTYWDQVKDLGDDLKEKSEYKFVDDFYLDNQKDTLSDGTTILSIVLNGNKDNTDGYLKIASEFKTKYYRLFAKELFAYKTQWQKWQEGIDDDENSDDDNEGIFSHSQFVTSFKSEYTNKYDVNAFFIRFTSENEFNDTLRAFGIKLNNNKYYFVKDNADDFYDDYVNDDTKRISYEDYIKHYNDLTTSDLTKENGVESISGKAMLEIFILLYNYMYGGYRDNLYSKYAANYDDLNNLRKTTYEIINDYAGLEDEKVVYDETVQKLINENADYVVYTRDDLDDKFGASLVTYTYETLKYRDDKGEIIKDSNSCYSTALQTDEKGKFIVYKLSDNLEDIADALEKKYEKYYLDSTLTSIDFYDYIMDKENNVGLYDAILDELIKGQITDSNVASYINDEKENVGVKIYNEALEIAYAKDNANYSKTIFGNSDSNVLASISYNNKNYNMNIVANADDKDSIIIAGTDKPYSVWDELERTSGYSTAINILSKKIIKDTQVYKDVINDKENYNLYNTYLQNVLTQFANDGYSSSGYPSSLGKYNFLMLYYHSADVNQIINDTFLVQLASSKTLTDYSNSDLAAFFKEYTDKGYTSYFSLSGKQLVVYMDADDDNKADKTEDWKDNTAKNWNMFDGATATTTLEEIAKRLIYDIYNKMSAAQGTKHADYITTIVEEINNSAKVIYESNPISSENEWAKYRYLGLNVKFEDVSATNSTTDIDFNLKQRLYDYATYDKLNDTEKYQFYINDTVPTEYVEKIVEEDVSKNSDVIIETEDGYVMVVLTDGTATPSAKWSVDDYSDTLLKDIVIKYNEKYIKVSDVFNEEDSLNTKQIVLYILDYSLNGASTLSPASTSGAINAFLSPVYTRYTATATQQIITLNFIKQYTNQADSTELYDVVKFKIDNYNGANGIIDKTIIINERISDDYPDLNKDTTNTSKLFNNWWDDLNANIKKFIVQKGENK